MKKLIFTILSVVLLASSCDMNKKPHYVIDDQSAIQSVEDALKMRNYLYIRLRGMSAGSYIYAGELMSDLFHATIGFGNRGGVYYRWQWSASDEVAEGVWAGCYTTTANANFLLEQLAKLDQTAMSDDDKAMLSVIEGECAFMKAYTMFYLVQLFSEPYTKNPNALGVMLVPKYNPTSDQSQYPGRSTVAETYTFIEENLKIAAQKLANVEGAVASEYLTIDAVTALQARIALYKGDYATAIEKSTSLIGPAKYEFVADEDEFEDLWTNDSGKECIMQLYADYALSSLPSSLSYNYSGISNASGTVSPDYIPENWVLSLYEAGDVRASWFEGYTLTFQNIKGNAYILNKFPGNPELNAADAKDSNWINKIKLFRIAEQYLIAAEAYAMQGGNDIVALKYYNDLRRSRIAGYQDESIIGDALVEAIREERVRELIGEGFRFYDLKRYGKGFERSQGQNDNILNGANDTQSELLSKPASDYRWLWPIPQAEIDSNPQIKEQQNGGYTN